MCFIPADVEWSARSQAVRCVRVWRRASQTVAYLSDHLHSPTHAATRGLTAGTKRPCRTQRLVQNANTHRHTRSATFPCLHVCTRVYQNTVVIIALIDITANCFLRFKTFTKLGILRRNVLGQVRLIGRHYAFNFSECCYTCEELPDSRSRCPPVLHQRQHKCKYSCVYVFAA